MKNESISQSNIHETFDSLPIERIEAWAQKHIAMIEDDLEKRYLACRPLARFLKQAMSDRNEKGADESHKAQDEAEIRIKALELAQTVAGILDVSIEALVSEI